MAKPKSKEASWATTKFYEEVEKLLRASGKYVNAVNLECNLSDPQEAFKVRHVLNKYYEGDMNKLNSYIRRRRQELLDIIDEINQRCLTAGVMTVRKPQKLIELLKSSKRRNAWRKYMRRHLRQDEIVSLQDLEREYRNPSF